MDFSWEIWKMFLYIISICSVLVYFYWRWESNLFKKRGVKNLPFDGPFIGNMWRVLLQKEHNMDLVKRIYDSFPDQKYVGYKQINKLLFMIRDVELIKQVTIKDFDHFVNHFVVLDETSESLFGANLFALKGEKWRDMRATLSPAFTSSKMKNMFQLIAEIGEQMVDFYNNKMLDGEWKERGLVEVEMKDAYTRYTNDVIATSAFGLKIDSLTNRDNDFYEMGKESTKFSGIRMFKIFIVASFPKLNNLLPFEIFPMRLKQFFRNVVWNTIRDRKAKGIVRHDMIQLLMEAKDGSLKYDAAATEKSDAGFATVEESHVGQRTVKRQWTDDDITAQAMLFFIAGFETASTLLCFITHELALNADVQRQLQDEIDEFYRESNGRLSYETLAKMSYLDMVVSETLRKWPPVSAVDRECVKEYQLPPPDNKSNRPCVVNKGEGIWIPIYAIHRDPEFYPNPDKFDPMRFSDENKDNIKPFSFLPFGIGPRNCIGSRFALMEVKAIVFQLLRKFDIVQTAKTQDPIKISPSSFNLGTDNGFWVGLKPRQN